MRLYKEMEPLLLASASPRRRELLVQAGIPFTVMPGNVNEENVDIAGTPFEKAEALALLKAREVSGRVSGGIVLGADTMVVVDDRIYGKPLDEEDAKMMLRSLGGREHLVVTGIALVDASSGKSIKTSEVTKVFFAELKDSDIDYYISTGEPFGKAGAYAIQGIGALFVERIEGCYSNVVGLPLMRLKRMLEQFGFNPMGR